MPLKRSYSKSRALSTQNFDSTYWSIYGSAVRF